MKPLTATVAFFLIALLFEQAYPEHSGGIDTGLALVAIWLASCALEEARKNRTEKP